jgi:hypothetical protein
VARTKCFISTTMSLHYIREATDDHTPEYALIIGDGFLRIVRLSAYELPMPPVCGQVNALVQSVRSCTTMNHCSDVALGGG